MEQKPTILKGILRTTITLSRNTEALARDMQKSHQAGSLSSYLAGLVALDALRANKNNVDAKRKVRFLPYGIAVSVLDDDSEEPA